MRYSSVSRKRFQVEIDEIENGYEVSFYIKDAYKRFYTENLELALILVSELKNKGKGKKK